MSRLFLIGLSIALFALLVSPSYSATITTYTDAASFNAAATGLTTDTFEDVGTAGTVKSYNDSNGVTSNGVQFIGYTSTPGTYLLGVYDTAAPQWQAWYNYGTGDALGILEDRPPAGTVPYIQILLPTNVTAVSMNLFDNQGAMSYTVNVAGTPFTVATNAHPTPGFWGFTSDTAITSITLNLQGTVFNGGSMAFLDNFQFGTAGVQDIGQAPEAATFLLIGSGLIGLVFFKKRIRGDR